MSKRPPRHQIKNTKCCRFNPKTKEPRELTHADNDHRCIFAHPIDGDIWERAAVNPKMEDIFSKKGVSKGGRRSSGDSRRFRSPSPTRHHGGRSRSPDGRRGGSSSRRGSEHNTYASHAATSPPPTWGKDPPSRRNSRVEPSSRTHLSPTQTSDTHTNASMWGASSPMYPSVGASATGWGASSPMHSASATGWGASSPTWAGFGSGTSVATVAGRGQQTTSAASPSNAPMDWQAASGWDASSPLWTNTKSSTTDATAVAGRGQPTTSAASPIPPSSPPAPANSSTGPMDWQPTVDNKRGESSSESRAELGGTASNTNKVNDTKTLPATAAASNLESPPPLPTIPRTQSPVSMDANAITEKDKEHSLPDPAAPAPGTTQPSSSSATTRKTEVDQSSTPTLPAVSSENRKEDIKETVRILQKLTDVQTRRDGLLEAIKEHEKELMLMKDAQREEGRKILSRMEDECKTASLHREALLDKLFNLGDRTWAFGHSQVPGPASGNSNSNSTMVSPLELYEKITNAKLDLEMIKKQHRALFPASAAAQERPDTVANTSSEAEPPPTGSAITPALTSKKRKLEETVVPSAPGAAPVNSKDRARLRKLLEDFEDVRGTVRDAENRMNEWSEDLYRVADQRIKQLDKIKAKADAKQKEREEECVNAVKELERAHTQESEKVANVLKAAEGLDESFEELENENKVHLTRLNTLQTQQTAVLHSIRALSQSSHPIQPSHAPPPPFTREVAAQQKDDIVQATRDEYSQLLAQHSRQITEQVQARQDAMLKDALDKLRPTLQLQEMVRTFVDQQRRHAQGMHMNSISPDMQ